MAIVLVQAFTTIDEVDASVTKTYVSGPTQGNLLIAVAYGTNAIGNASITGWAVAVSVLQGPSSTIAIFYKIAGASESSTVTLDWTSSTQTKLAIGEVSGVNTLDQVAGVATTGAGVTSRSSGTTATTIAADELLVAAVGMGNTTSAQSWSNSFNAAFNLSNTMLGATRIVTSTGAYETTLSWTTSRIAGGVIATFRQVSAGQLPKPVIIQQAVRQSYYY